MAEGFKAQARLSDFYDSIQELCGTEPVPLISEWQGGNVELVRDRIKAAIDQCGILGTALENFAFDAKNEARTNQSQGNVAAEAIASAIGCRAEHLAVEKLAGSGYPDRILVLSPENFRCCIELKATSAWKERDTNRRVLTSSTKKLLKAVREGKLPEAPHHLLVTAIYDKPDGIVRRVRLDFLQPNSLVNIRFEASTSHRLLSSANHEIREIS